MRVPLAWLEKPLIRPLNLRSYFGKFGGGPLRQTTSCYSLRAAIEDTERLTGRQIERAYVDKGYRGHDAPNPHRVFISGQKRGVFGAIKRELRRRSAIEPVIGHMKAEGHLGRCYLKGTAGDAANAILTAIGHNLRLVLAWLRTLLRLILAALHSAPTADPKFKLAS